MCRILQMSFPRVLSNESPSREENASHTKFVEDKKWS